MSTHELEDSLRALAPLPATFDRDRLMYKAGQASAKGLNRWLALATGALALTVVVLGATLALVKPETKIERIIVTVPAERPPLPPKIANVPDRPREEETSPVLTEGPWQDAPHLAYFRLERDVLRWGLDGLPTLPTLPGPALSAEPVTSVRSAKDWNF